nr:hypothetical protein [Acetobacter persici]
MDAPAPARRGRRPAAAAVVEAAKPVKATRKAAAPKQTVAKTAAATKAPAAPKTRTPRAKAAPAEKKVRLSAVEKLRIVQDTRRQKRYDRLAAEAAEATAKPAATRGRKASKTTRSKK